MKPRRESRTGEPGPGRRAARVAPRAFEELLRQIAVEMSAAGGGAGVATALDRVARFFNADRALVEPGLPGAPEAGDALPAGGSRVSVAVAGGDGATAGTVTLWAQAGGQAWGRASQRRLGLVGAVILGGLRLWHVERELYENQVWLYMALESVTVGTWDWDIVTDRVRYIAPFNRLPGTIEVRETTGAQWSQATHPHDVPAARAEVEKAIAGESESFAIVVRSRRPPYRSGEWFQIYSRGRVVERGPDGRATRIMGVHEDVTEAMRKAESERQRDVALANAARMASFGALTSSLAHEINQPLAALTSYLDAAVRLLPAGDPRLEDVGKALERSVALAERTSQIVNRLRRLLRREPPLCEPFDAVAALRAVRDQLARECRAAGVEVSIAAEGLAATVHGDRVQVEQALVNLVRNAVEALAETDRSAREVVLGLAELGDVIALRVADNGPGLPEGALERVFEPFFTTKQGGTGLGLVISESIAEAHGGKLRVESTGPAGTVFVLDLPAAQEARP